MIRNTIAVILSLITFFPSQAQKGSSCPEDLVPKYGQNRQWGYTNILGQWVINPIYTKVSPYIENKAVVMKGLQYGVIDCEGNVVLPPQYELLTNFRYGKIWAKQNGLWSLLNDKGKVLMAPQFTEINPIANTELTWVQKDGLWGLMNEQRGNFICKPQFKVVQIMSENASLVEVNEYFGVVNHVNCQYLIPAEIARVKKIAPRMIIFQQKGKWGLFNELGMIRLNPEFDTLFVKFSNVVEGRKGNSYGLYDLTGKELLAPVYESIGDYSEGYFPIKKNGKYGYASRFGKIFIQPSYEAAGQFKNQAAIVKSMGNYGVIDVRNKFIIPAKYAYIGTNVQGTYFVTKIKGESKYFMVDKGLKKKFETGFDTVYVSDTATFTRVLNDHKFSFLNTSLSKASFPGNFDYAASFKDHLALVGNGKTFGVVNETGKIIVPFTYDSLSYAFWGGRLMIQTFKNGKKGIVDPEGKTILGNEYDLISFALPNVLKVKREGKYGMIKTTGTVVDPFSFDYLSNKEENPELPQWPAVGAKGKVYGLVNEKGEMITKEKFSEYKYLGEKFYAFASGKSSLVNQKGEVVGEESFDEIAPLAEGRLPVKKGKKWGYINTKGVITIPPEFEEAGNFENKFAVVKKSGKYGVISTLGKIVVMPEYESFSNKNGERILTKSGVNYLLEKTGELRQLH